MESKQGGIALEEHNKIIVRFDDDRRAGKEGRSSACKQPRALHPASAGASDNAALLPLQNHERES